MLSKLEIQAAIEAAHAAPFTPAPASGCGRAYVSLSGLDRKEVNAVSAACKRLGLIFQRKAYYGLRNAIYLGYDNADGRALGKAEAFASTLKARGISAYVDACAD